ncbi:MAG: TIGR03936 family radical SAM-associated protein [Oscillospiraceae bacterium]|nr:TIGR03936 family radical SAM-associated protein [Oscillospiraceae bacterium]
MSDLKNYRILFEKKQNMKYISHLDLNRCMTRCIRRSGLPAWYTEGFHPHLYLMFPLALSLGVESICEIMDFRLTEEIPESEILEKLNAVFPDGLRALRVGSPIHQAQEITHAEYLLHLIAPELPDVFAYWEKFLSQPEILIRKRTKKGFREMDLKPFVQVIEAGELSGIPSNFQNSDKILSLVIRLPAGNEQNMNINLIPESFQNYAGKPVLTEYACRTKIFCENFQEFF